MVFYAYVLKKQIECMIFSSAIRLHSLIKLSLNKLLKILEALKNFRFVF